MKNSNIILLTGMALFLAFGGLFYFLSQKSFVTDIVPPTARIHPEEDKPKAPGDVALLVLDVLGDGGALEAGSITAPCLSEKNDQIADQFEMLLTRLQEDPSRTQFFDGVYVTFMDEGPRPLFQVRLPDRAYCEVFASGYQKCWQKRAAGGGKKVAVDAVKACIEDAAKGANISEKEQATWRGLKEHYSSRDSGR